MAVHRGSVSAQGREHYHAVLHTPVSLSPETSSGVAEPEPLNDSDVSSFFGSLCNSSRPVGHNRPYSVKMALGIFATMATIVHCM